jgi:CRISPR-associated protein Cmr3
MTTMNRTSLFIEPDDVWLFRDGRPFAAGDQARAASIFPPTPRTMQGALRSARLAQSGEPFHFSGWSQSLKSEIGTPNDFGGLNLRGPILAKRKGHSREVRRYFPLPANVTRLNNRWHILAPQAATDIETNWPIDDPLLLLLPPADSEPEKFEVGWLCEHALRSYLCGDVCGVHMHTGTDLFTREPRMGVQIDSYPKRPTEGNLYQVEFIRLQSGVGLLMEVTGLALTHEGLLQLGGEMRAAKYETVATTIDLAPAGRLSVDTPRLRFKLYFATPAIFAKGWLPNAIDEPGLEGNWNGIAVRLVSAALGKTQVIGGRDISQRDAQHPLRRVAPAGSVYFFEVTDASTQATDIFNAFDGRCVSDLDAQIGFGLCYVGGW